MSKVTVQIPLIVADVEFDLIQEITQVSFNNNFSGQPIVIPSNTGFKSKRFRVTIEALDVTARLESDVVEGQ